MGTQTTSIYTAETTTQLAIISCCNCGIVWGQPSAFDRECHDQGPKKIFYCPNGHPQHYMQTTEARLRRELEEERNRIAEWRRRYSELSTAKEHTENSLRSTRGHLTRVKRRVEAGVCIHCNRTFQQVARHMARQHPNAEGRS